MAPVSKTLHGRSRRASQALMLLAMAITIAVPRYLSLGKYVTIDEHTWLTQSANFAAALHRRDFAATFQIEHPGVTTMWLGALAQRLIYPDYVREHPKPIDRASYEATLREKLGSPLPMLVMSRALVTGVITLCLLLSFVMLRTLIGTRSAVLGMLFVALDPFAVAHTQLLHVDGLLSSFVLVGLLSLLAYLHNHRPTFLILSGIAGGLAFLTKSTSLLALPGAIMIVFANRLIHHQGTIQEKLKWAVWQSRILLVCILIAMITIFAVWPALWISPSLTLSRVINGAIHYAQTGHEHPVFYQGQIIPTGRIGLSYYPLAYLWRSTPTALIGMVLALSSATLGYPAPMASKRREYLVYFLLMACLFLSALSFGYKKFDRYMLPAWFPLLIASGLGWDTVVAWLHHRSLSWKRRCLIQLTLACGILLHGVEATRVFPYPLSYYSPLLGGGNRAAQVFTIGWGEGLSDAAAYLNGLPHPENTEVTTWYLPCFSYYYAGHSYEIPNATEIDPAHLDALLEKDYVVTYINQWQRRIPPALFERLSEWCLVHTITLNDIEYVHIYSREHCNQ